MTGEKLHCLFQQLQCVAMKLPLIEEFPLVVPAEGGHPELALRVIWQHAAPEYYNRGVENAIVVAKSEAVEHISGVGRHGSRHPTGGCAEEEAVWRTITSRPEFGNEIR
jgi:hypothetical protein